MKTLRLITKISLTLMFILFASSLYSQKNTVKTLIDLGTHYDYSYTIRLQDDGKVLQAGDAWGTPCIIRFDTLGNLDNTFGEAGKLFTTWSCSSNPDDNDILIQQDGKIVFGATYSTGAYSDFILARYNIDGSLDYSFGTDGKVITSIGEYHDKCSSIAMQSDGKIVAAGSTSIEAFDKIDFAIVRYNADGTIDNSFGNNGIVTTNIGLGYNFAKSMVVQPDDKIIVVGEANDEIFSDFVTVRYNPNGTLDNSFGNNGIVRTPLSSTYDFARGVVVQPNGKIIVAGSSQSSLYNYNIAMVRYNTDGTIDDTFGTNGIVSSDLGNDDDNDFGEDIALQSDGKIVIVGSSLTGSGYDIATVCYNNSGVIDNSFGTNGIIYSSFGNGDSEGHAVCLGDSDEIIIAGNYNHGAPDYFDFALLRLFSNQTPNSYPILISPENGATDILIDITFAWSPFSEAANYNLQVSKSESFNSIDLNVEGISSISYYTNDLDLNTTYFWRVNAVANGIVSPWSETWSFNTTDLVNIQDANNEQFRLYPIPARDKLFIDGIEFAKVNVSILSINGLLIKQIEGVGIKELDLSDLQNGIYLVKISNEKINHIKYISKI